MAVEPAETPETPPPPMPEAEAPTPTPRRPVDHPYARLCEAHAAQGKAQKK